MDLKKSVDENGHLQPEYIIKVGAALSAIIALWITVGPDLLRALNITPTEDYRTLSNRVERLEDNYRQLDRGQVRIENKVDRVLCKLDNPDEMCLNETTNE